MPLLGNSKSTATFYALTISHHVLDMGALQRRMGLGAMVGNDRIARALGPDEDLTKTVGEPVQLFVHENCGMTETRLYEILGEKED
jgi:hypothetical protein